MSEIKNARFSPIQILWEIPSLAKLIFPNENSSIAKELLVNENNISNKKEVNLDLVRMIYTMFINSFVGQSGYHLVDG